MMVLRAQLHALWSTPATRWLAALVLVVGTGYTVLATTLFPLADDGVWAAAALTYAGLVFALTTAAATAGTWTTGAVRSELVATPRRRRLFLGKAGAVAVSGFVLGTVTALTAVAVAGATPVGVRVALLGGLVLAAYGLFGFGAGALLRRTGPAVVAVLLLCLVLPPFTLGGTVAGLDAATLTLTQSSAFLLGGGSDVGACLFGIGLWAVVPAAVAGLRFRTTDA